MLVQQPASISETAMAKHLTRDLTVVEINGAVSQNLGRFMTLARPGAQCHRVAPDPARFQWRARGPVQLETSCQCAAGQQSQSLIMSRGSSLRGLSEVSTTISLKRPAASPIRGRLVLSRSPPHPNNVIMRPSGFSSFAVANRFRSASSVWAIIYNHEKRLARIDALEAPRHGGKLGDSVGDDIAGKIESNSGPDGGKKYYRTLIRPTMCERTSIFPTGVSTVNSRPEKDRAGLRVVMSAPGSSPYVSVRAASPANCLP